MMRSIIGLGQSEPAMMPVLKLVMSMSFDSNFFRASSMAMNIVGTPYSAEHFSSNTAYRDKLGSKLSEG